MLGGKRKDIRSRVISYHVVLISFCQLGWIMGEEGNFFDLIEKTSPTLWLVIKTGVTFSRLMVVVGRPNHYRQCHPWEGALGLYTMKVPSHGEQTNI